MNRITGTSIGSFILGAVFLLLPVFVGAGPVPVSVHCTNSTTIASKLSAAAASASRTLFVTGLCVENVTVRNLRVIIDGTGGAILKALDPTKAAITFTGGTTDATIRNFGNPTGGAGIGIGGSIESGLNGGTGTLDNNGDPFKGGNAIAIQNGAVVTVFNNKINVNGCGTGIAVSKQAIGTASANLINGNNGAGTGAIVPSNEVSTVGAVTCAGSSGISASDSGQLALGAKKTPVTVDSAGNPVTVDPNATNVTGDNRNAIIGHKNKAGIKCSGGGIVTGVKASSTNAAGTLGGMTDSVFTNDGAAPVSGVNAIASTAANVIASGTVGTGVGTTTGTPGATALVSCFTDL